MVVHSRRAARRRPIDISQLDLAHLAFFLGLRVNELVVAGGRDKGFRGFRESHGFVVQHLIEADRSISELAARMDVTQQAASKAVAELAGLGYVEIHVAGDRRERRVALSKRGWKAVLFARQTRKRIHGRLRRAIGGDEYERARSILVRCLDVLGGIERIQARRVRPPQ